MMAEGGFSIRLAGSRRHGGGICLRMALWFGMFWVATLLRAHADPAPSLFRLGFGNSMFSDVNENDARAAVKVWGQMIARERNVPTDPDPVIFKNMDAMRQSLQEKRVDALGITMIEYHQLRREVAFAPIFLTYNAGSITERYVLLAHREGPVKGIGDLRGRSLLAHTNPRTCLAQSWLDTVLVGQGHPRAARFAARVSRDTRLSNVVLPVFFRQADACLVTRSGFDTMSELNPQLAGRLIVIAESPDMVPAIFAFRADYNPVFKDELISGINELKTTPAGRQVLTIFHSEDIAEQPASCLDTALELIATHERLVK